MTATLQSSSHRAIDTWLPYRRAKSDPAIRLFCFAHAGGSAAAFRAWDNLFPPYVEICAVQLPGREARSAEPLRRSMTPLVDELKVAVRPLLDRPFALFGHSLGAKIAFELGRVLENEHAGPAHVFVSGSPAPHLKLRDIPLHQLPDPGLREQLRSFGGTPAEVLEHAELVAYILPVFRGDLELNETYSFEAGNSLSSPLTAFGGSSDPEVPFDAIEAWSQHTSGPFRSRILGGGHFFLFERQDIVTDEIWRDLSGATCKATSG